MTDALQALYDYTLSQRFSFFLMNDRYRDAEKVYTDHLRTLERELPQAQRDVLQKLCDAQDEQRDLELEAMFQAARAVLAEL